MNSETSQTQYGTGRVPNWFIAVCVALLAWGSYYIASYTAGFRRDVFDRADLDYVQPPAATIPDPNPRNVEELKRIGEQKYQSICAACHGNDGKGQPAQSIPPLDGSEWVIGEQASAARLSRIILYGMQGPIEVKGHTYSGGVMPPQGNVLKDYQIAGVLTYIRNQWSNKGDPDNNKPLITADEVKAARAAEGKRKTNGTHPVTAAELLKLPLTYTDPPPIANEGK